MQLFMHIFMHILYPAHPPIQLSVCRQPPALAELTALYVGRTCSLWREAAVMLWLEESVKEVLRRVDTEDPLVEDCQNK